MEHDPSAVRAEAKRHANELADMLNAYADLIEEAIALRELVASQARIISGLTKREADPIERHAKLEKHAEDMAKCLDSSIAVDQSPEGELSFRDEWSYNVDQLVHAYRADFPKEG